MSGNRHGPIDGRPLAFVTEPAGTEPWTIDARTPELLDSWCSAVGPTAVVLWQYMARRIHTGQFDFTIDELASYTGTLHGKVWHALDRLTMFRACQWLDPERLEVNVVTNVFVRRPRLTPGPVPS